MLGMGVGHTTRNGTKRANLSGNVLPKARCFSPDLGNYRHDILKEVQ